MNQIVRDKPLQSNCWISIHDKRMTSIVCNDESILLYFADGFTLIEDDQIVAIPKGYIELSDCSPDNFNCIIIKRRKSKKGARLYGKSISLVELGKMLAKKRKSVEIYLEQYDFNLMHWRGEFFPCKKRGLADCIVIEAMDFFTMTYHWD